jgi:HAD superfamily hydrolase (TIGR01490 family)
MALLLPWLLAYKLNLYSNEKAKQRMLSYFYKGWNYGTFKRKGEEFCRTVLPQIIRPDASEKIAWHQKKHHRIIVVTASAEEWVRPWCEANDLECLATQLEAKDNKITGKLSSKNCYGPEKANRVKNTLSPASYETIYAYGDTKGDREMLKMATKPYYRYFN